MDDMHVQERDCAVMDHNLAVMGAAMSARLLDMKQVAERLNIGRSTAFDLVISGQLRSVKIGRRRLVPEQAIADFINKASA